MNRERGVCGIVSAWAVAALALATLPACRCESSPDVAEGYASTDRGGATTWNVGGRDYVIQDTYFQVLPEGLQFTIETEVPPGVDPARITEQQAYDVALPLMLHAYQKRLHERTAMNRVGSGAQDVQRIGVALFVRGRAGSSRGHRVSRSLEDIARRASQ